ncbi:MAG: hypothetical protein GU345_01955 [Acidilobus sp.]|nr:hypothetical protein [Acidilobus sp.]
MKSQTKTRAKSVVDLLRSVGFKASTPREGDLCLESYLECCGQVLRLVFFDGRYTDDLVIKVTPEVGGCEDALYASKGLYVIGGSDNEVVKKIIQKAKFLSTTLRSVSA